MVFRYIFFFKQKTAYEMRISDWSSDVCSSDLADACERGPAPTPREMTDRSARPCAAARISKVTHDIGNHRRRLCRPAARPGPARAALARPAGRAARHPRDARRCRGGRARAFRSEEHTSELQSLMRISYAVFCLKKKNPTP